MYQKHCYFCVMKYGQQKAYKESPEKEAEPRCSLKTPN